MRSSASSLAHFQDVLCGYWCPSSMADKAQELFAEGLKDFEFNSGRRLSLHNSQNTRCYTNSNLHDRHQNSERLAVFVGYASGLSSAPEEKRRLSHFFSSRPASELDLHQFVDSRFSGVLSTNEKIFLFTDYFGKKKLFYKKIGSILFFSNEFRTLALIPSARESIDSQALREYLSFGAVLGHKTLSNQIFSVPLQSYMEFDGQDLRTHRWPSFLNTGRSRLSTSLVIEAAEAAMKFYVRDLGMTHADLTGGADTRFSMCVAKKLGLPLVYTADFKNAQTSANAYYDLETAKLLAEKFSLTLVETPAGPFRSSSAFARSPFDRHRAFDGDLYTRTLSGMYGGEILGAWSYENFLGPQQMERYQKNEARLSQTDKPLFLGTLPPFEVYGQSPPDYAEPDLLHTLFLTYSTPQFYRADSPAWFEPYLLTNRKISLFLSDALLRVLGHSPCRKDLEDYAFYQKLYQDYAPEALSMPFHSEIIKGLQGGRSIKSLRSFPSLQRNSSALDEDNDLPLRLQVLNDWLALFQANPQWPSRLQLDL